MENPIVTTLESGKIVFGETRKYFYLKLVGSNALYLSKEGFITSDLNSAESFTSKTLAELFMEMENIPEGLFLVWEKK